MKNGPLIDDLPLNMVIFIDFQYSIVMLAYHWARFSQQTNASEGEEGAVGEQGDVGAEGPEGLEADVAGLATMGHSAEKNDRTWYAGFLKWGYH